MQRTPSLSLLATSGACRSPTVPAPLAINCSHPCSECLSQLWRTIRSLLPCLIPFRFAPLGHVSVAVQSHVCPACLLQVNLARCGEASDRAYLASRACTSVVGGVAHDGWAPVVTHCSAVEAAQPTPSSRYHVLESVFASHGHVLSCFITISCAGLILSLRALQDKVFSMKPAALRVAAMGHHMSSALSKCREAEAARYFTTRLLTRTGCGREGNKVTRTKDSQ